MRGWCALVALLLAAACDGPLPIPDGGSSAGATARFELSDDGAPIDFAAVPFPSDLYLDDGGHPRLGALPVRGDGSARWIAMRELFAVRTGFCATCNTYFGIDGALDPTSVPASATPDTVASIDDAIVMVDVDPGSPDHGRLIPLRIEHQDDRIAVRPVRGVVLRRGRRYAVAVTTSIRAEDGSPLAPSAAFLAIRDGEGGSSSIERARSILAPALDELAALGLPRERIASLAAFSIGDPTLDLRDARAAVHAAPAPVAIVDRVWSTPEELDELLGVPAEDRPGIDVPSLTEGTRAIRHAGVALVVTGRFGAPRLVTGSGTELGTPLRDPSGHITGGSAQDVPFLLIIPSGADLATLPVIVHHHGFNASRVTGFVLADTAARAGAAVLSIDAFQHGERAHEREDVLHQMRGDVAGADGFSETDQLAVSGRVFGIQGAPEGMQLFAGYPLGAFLQFVGDAMAAIRFAREGDLSALRAASPSLATLAFDPDRVLYAGNSMGAVIGTGVLAVESDAAAYVLNVLPGSIVDSLADGAEFRPLTETVFLPVLGVQPGFDEVTRSITFDPIVDLFRWAIEPVDPHALAPYLFLDPVAEGSRPDVLAQLASLDQLAAPTGAQAMLAAAGIPGVGEYEIAPVASVSAPVRANLETITVAAYRFDPGAHGMLEILEQPSTHELPLVPPLVPRASPIVVTNPITEVHAQIEHFVRTRVESGRAEIR